MPGEVKLADMGTFVGFRVCVVSVAERVSSKLTGWEMPVDDDHCQSN